MRPCCLWKRPFEFKLALHADASAEQLLSRMHPVSSPQLHTAQGQRNSRSISARGRSLKRTRPEAMAHGEFDHLWRRLGTNAAELSLDFTLPTGQSFRWKATASHMYTGVIGQRAVSGARYALQVARVQLCCKQSSSVIHQDELCKSYCVAYGRWLSNKAQIREK